MYRLDLLASFFLWPHVQPTIYCVIYKYYCLMVWYQVWYGMNTCMYVCIDIFKFCNRFKMRMVLLKYRVTELVIC